jgi:alkanesulfonate monooxygenase
MMSIGFTHIPHIEDNTPMFLSKLGLLERTCFGQIVVGAPHSTRENIALAAEIVRRTTSARIVVAVAPADILPVDAASVITELDRASDGRISVRLVSGQTTPSCHVAAVQQMDEFVVLLKRLWSNDRPISHEGCFYRLEDAYIPLKGPQGASIPLWTAGSSGTSRQFTGRHANVAELMPGSPETVTEEIARVRTAAGQFGRANKIRFVLTVEAGGSETDARQSSPVDAVRIGGTAAEMVNARHPYVSAGVSEFAIAGLSGYASISGFSWQVAPLLRNRNAIDGHRQNIAGTLLTVPHGRFAQRQDVSRAARRSH